jgi:hypothetical protein
MIRYSIIFGFQIFLFWGCLEKSDYPILVKQHKLERQFDRARLETYKLIAGDQCSCQGIKEVEGDVLLQDTLPLLAFDFVLDGVKMLSDTTTIFLRAAILNKKNTPQSKFKRVLFIPYENCFSYIGFIFVGDSETPVYANVGEAYFTFDEDQSRIRTQQLLDCIESGVEINDWAIDQLKNKQ